MAPENPIYAWPRADASTMLLVFLFVFGLLFLAIFLEWLRRRRERAVHLRAEWTAARQIAQERELTTTEWRLLESLIRRHHPSGPHKAVTIRQVFDSVVDADLAEAKQAGEAALFEQRGIILRDIRNRLGLTYIPIGQRIQSTRELYLNQVLWAGIDKEDAEWFRMHVCSVDEAHFQVTANGAHRAPPFKPGQQLIFRMWREEDARYEFRAILDRIEASPTAFVFQHSQDLRRMQAREHFRLSYDQRVNLGVVSAPLDGNLQGIEMRPVVARLRGRVTSLSAGGLAVLVQQPVPRHVLLRLDLPLVEPDLPSVEVMVRLIEAIPLSGGQYLLRGEFTGLNEIDQETITHFIFRKQQHSMPTEAQQQFHAE